MILDCQTLSAYLNRDQVCSTSDAGVRLLTDCLYPSADPVFVHVASTGKGFRISDGGECARAIFSHGRDERFLKAGFEEAQRQHGLDIEAGALVAVAPDVEWLRPAILAVANGAALAARFAVEKASRRAEILLSDRIFESLARLVPAKRLARDVEWRGQSGKRWNIDVAVFAANEPLLIRGLTGHPASVSFNYTIFSDIGTSDARRMCVSEQAIDSDDASLLRQVAELVPLKSLEHVAVDRWRFH